MTHPGSITEADGFRESRKRIMGSEAQLSETSDRYSEIESVIAFFHALGGWTKD